MNAPAAGIGASSKRREDVRFLTGRGKYTDDINLPKQTYAVFVRSEVAHGKLNGLDISAAEAAPGVLKVFTAKDFEGVGGVPCGWQVTDKNGEPMKEPKHPILAEGKVRHVGDPIAVVVAETLAQARDAAELVEADIEELPAVIDMRTAASGGTAVHEDVAPDNICYDWEFVAENKDAVDQAIRSAAHVTTLELVNNRLVANPMEPRCAIGDYDASREEHTLHTTSQNPHVIRLLMGAFVLGIPEHKLRVVAPDVGGGFGSKIYHYAEEAFVTFAAKVSGARSSGPRTARKRSCPTRRAATTSPRSSWPWTRTTTSRRCAARPTRIWAPISPPSRPASRPGCTARCWRATTRRR
jgi:carbon-monoxide dehydrogenase large subunit